MPHDAYERILRRMIAIGRRIERRPNIMWIVVGARDRHVHKPDVELPQNLEESDRLSEIVFEGIFRVSPKGIDVRQAVFIRNSRTERTRHGARGIWLERHSIDSAQSHANSQSGRLSANALNDLTQEASPILKAAPIGSGPCDSTEKLVAEIAMTMLDVDEIVATLLRAFCRNDEVFDQAFDFVVADHRSVGRVTKLLIEERMVVGDNRFESGVVVRLAKPTRVRELETDDQSAIIARRLLVRLDQYFAKLRDPTLRVVRHIQLFRIGPTVEAHRAGLAAPDQLGAAETEALPAPLSIFRGSAVKLAIPAFHRLHPKPMPDG